MVQDALRTRASVLALAGLAALALSLGSARSSFAQPAIDGSAAAHAAQAHGQPIVDGHPVQPTPAVVEERMRHHEQMLEAERNGSVRPTVGQPASPPTAAARIPLTGAKP